MGDAPGSVVPGGDCQEARGASSLGDGGGQPGSRQGRSPPGGRAVSGPLAVISGSAESEGKSANQQREMTTQKPLRRQKLSPQQSAEQDAHHALIAAVRPKARARALEP